MRDAKGKAALTTFAWAVWLMIVSTFAPSFSLYIALTSSVIFMYVISFYYWNERNKERDDKWNMSGWILKLGER